MSKSDNLAELLEALAESAEKQVDPKTEDDTKKSARVEEKDTRKGDPVGKAKEEVGLALWEGIRKKVPSFVLLLWIGAFVASVALSIVVASLLALWISYVLSIWNKPESILPLLIKTRDLGVATAFGALLTYARLRWAFQKPPR